MISLILSFVVLIACYLVYSRFTEKIFGPDRRMTPGLAVNDGVDCVPMAKPKTLLVQLLNIAGTGPIFGALMGAVFGPVVFLWIVFGSILGGAVHDFMSGMIAARHKGESIAELSGIYIGKVLKWIMRVFCILLMVLCGAVFITSPANLLASLTPGLGKYAKWFWVAIIIVYYFLATILPIDKIIGKLYPVFGILLIGMAIGVMGGTFAHGYAQNIPEIWNGFGVKNPNGLPTWPFMCITVACGAISGFHATQSPMMSKCIQTEKQGRQVFYGAMIIETVIALIWASVGVAVYGSTQALWDVLQAKGGAGPVVYDICIKLLGKVGGGIAIVGVVVCPITTGDTAFRGARLLIAETFHVEQKKIPKRLLITIPLIAVGAGLCFVNFDILWRYFSWANQTLAMITLWVATFYLLKKGRYRFGSFITAIPAAFMIAVSITYILAAPEGAHLINFRGNTGLIISYSIGGGLALGTFITYVIYFVLYQKKHRPQYAKFVINWHKENLIKQFKAGISNKSLIVNKKDLKEIYSLVNKNKFCNKYKDLFGKKKRRDRFLIKYIKYEIEYAIKKGIVVKDSVNMNAILIAYKYDHKRVPFFTLKGIGLFFRALFTGNIIVFYRLWLRSYNSFIFKDSILQNKQDLFVNDVIAFKSKVQLSKLFNVIEHKKVLINFKDNGSYYSKYKPVKNILFAKKQPVLMYK